MLNSLSILHLACSCQYAAVSVVWWGELQSINWTAAELMIFVQSNNVVIEYQLNTVSTTWTIDAVTVVDDGDPAFNHPLYPGINTHRPAVGLPYCRPLLSKQKVSTRGPSGHHSHREAVWVSEEGCWCWWLGIWGRTANQSLQKVSATKQTNPSSQLNSQAWFFVRVSDRSIYIGILCLAFVDAINV